MSRRLNRNKDQGAAAVEFVLVLPVLLIVLFGIIDFGRMMHAKLQLAEAAREGARAAALVSEGDARDTMRDIVGDDMAAAWDNPVVVTCAGPGTDARVELTYHFSFVTPLFGFGGDDGLLTLTQTAVMPCF